MGFDFGNANTQQIEAIKTTEGPLLIIAGPGTGKTFTLVKRIVYLITEKKVLPEEIMVATFTEKAAKELVTRITNELYSINYQININEMYVGTFHSICLRIIKEHLEFSRFKKNFRMLDQFDQTYMIFQHINEFRKLPYYDEVFHKNLGAWRQAGEISRYVNTLFEEMVNIEEMLTDKDHIVLGIANILKQYRKTVEEENLIDFSSIQTEAYSLLTNYPNILEEIKSQIKYVMVDEYQDTNFIQELLVLKIGEKENNICVVGDDDQGLYRFRGATIRNILEFPRHFNGKCKKVDLTINYRSEKDIIDFYNEWMSTPNDKFSWEGFRFFKTIEPGKDKYSKKTAVIKCSGSEELKNWFVNVHKFITELKLNGIIKDFNQVAFLCKSVKNDKIVDLIQYLEDNGVPVYSPRSEMFFTRPEIKELLGILIMCFPKYYIRLKNDSFDYPHPDLYNYYRDECIKAAKEIIKKNKNLSDWHKKIVKKHEVLKENTDYAFTGLLYQLFEFEPFISYISINNGNSVTDERAARNISIFLSVLSKYEYLHRIEVFTEKNIVSGIELFFNMYMRFLYDGGITEYEDDSEYAPSGSISFMTIHQSKGMEFPIVMVDSLSSSPRTNNDEIIELIDSKYFKRPNFELKQDIKYFDFWRLYYTAFSRAQNLLVLSCFEKDGRGKTPSKYFSEFYKKLPPYNEVDFSGVKTAEVKPVNIKDTFSFTSHIELYENCSIQYKFFKELGFTQIRIGATLFGTLVHETIEDIHRAALRHEESDINADNIKVWLDTNYSTLSKREHSYLGTKQIDAAYKQILLYVERMEKWGGFETTENSNSKESFWKYIQEAEVDVSLVKPNYILQGTVDLIAGNDDTVELVDFKSEKKPETEELTERLERYKRQLEVYAHLVEEKTGKKVSKMHLYYTGDDTGSPVVTFDKSKDAIDNTIKQFDDVVNKIQKKDFSTSAKNKKSCLNCDLRYFCKALKER